MSKNVENGHQSNENSKMTSTARVKYNFSLVVEQGENGTWMPEQRITMSGDVEVQEIRTAVRAAVRGALDGLSDTLEDENPEETNPEEDPEQDPE